MSTRLSGISIAFGAGSNAVQVLAHAAPKPIVLPENRQSVTLIVDATQLTFQEITSAGIVLPEFVYFPLTDTPPASSPRWWSYATVEFDVEQMGSVARPLSEVRYLIATSRPFYGPDDQGREQDNPNASLPTVGGPPCGIALLTNMSTLQSINLGGLAVSQNFPATMEIQHVAVPCGKGAMKFRMLCLQNDSALSGGGQGKYTLQFLNYDLPSSFIDVAFYGATQDGPL